MRRRNFITRVLRLATASILVVLTASVVLVLPWRWIPPPTTAFMIQKRIASADPIHYSWVSWSKISQNLAIAAVASEDQKFPFHRGFDMHAIAEALESNRQGGRIRGASTISQQVAKNLYLWPGQTVIRKGVEAYFTLWIELLWPKRRILEIYLNIAEFGPGIFGAAAAAEHIFGKSPDALTSREAATLVAVLPNPKQMSAARPSEYIRGRAEQIQRLVSSLGGAGYLRGL